VNIRHAGAIALMGWYLMVPPPLSHSPKNGQIVPLSQWTRAGAFQSEESCETKRAARSKLDPALALGAYHGLPAEQVYDAQCVATDDPRLKP
jgi:hypothetical protein